MKNATVIRLAGSVVETVARSYSTPYSCASRNPERGSNAVDSCLRRNGNGWIQMYAFTLGAGGIAVDYFCIIPR